MTLPMRLLRSLITIALGVYLVMGVYLYSFQEQLLFLPSAVQAGHPGQHGLGFDEVRFTADDGTVLHGWFVPAQESRFTVLFMHGNAGNISHRMETLRLFHELRLSTFIFDYRGYGRSEGTPSEKGLYQDAEAAWNYLVNQRGVDPRRIIVAGRSLGGAVAAWLASRRPSRALILESTFTSLPDLAAELYPLFPVRRLLRMDFPTRRRLALVNQPTLVIHSREDRLVPYHHGQALFQGLSPPRQFLEIHGDHNAGFLLSRERYSAGLIRFLFSLQAEPADFPDTIEQPQPTLVVTPATS